VPCAPPYTLPPTPPGRRGAQVKDRKLVAERMAAHVQAADTTPLLIFPEGTCVNNEYCVMFKRGAFDLGATVCPVAIKYNKIFVDAFWNSKRQSFTAHLARPCS
jgi:glycerol-3-phosphate O-acyltransferase 3/4